MSTGREAEMRQAVGAAILAQAEAAGFDGGRDGYPSVLRIAAAAADEARSNLTRWAAAARREGLSWSEVGAALGISKQAAQQRFADPATDESGEAGLIVRRGMTALNEVAAMREEGAAGRELVATGGLRLLFRQTDRRWEHRRVVAADRVQALLRAGSDWTYVDGWFPFHYLKRALGAA